MTTTPEQKRLDEIAMRHATNADNSEIDSVESIVPFFLSAIHEAIAPVVKERDELKAQQSSESFYPVCGCFTGDCPHTNANDCIEFVKAYVGQMEKEDDQLRADNLLLLSKIKALESSHEV